MSLRGIPVARPVSPSVANRGNSRETKGRLICSFIIIQNLPCQNACEEGPKMASAFPGLAPQRSIPVDRTPRTRPLIETGGPRPVPSRLRGLCRKNPQNPLRQTHAIERKAGAERAFELRCNAYLYLLSTAILVRGTTSCVLGAGRVPLCLLGRKEIPVYKRISFVTPRPGGREGRQGTPHGVTARSCGKQSVSPPPTSSYTGNSLKRYPWAWNIRKVVREHDEGNTLLSP
jgi:hypothetical protein